MLIAVLPGDGIGPEVTRQAQRVLELVCERHDIKVVFEQALIGGASIDALGTPLSDDVIELCRESRAILLGAVGGPKWDDMSVDTRPERGLLGIRKALGLFANLRPAQVFPALSRASSLRPEVVEGIEELHFYTLNRAELTVAACRLPGLRPAAAPARSGYR